MPSRSTVFTAACAAMLLCALLSFPSAALATGSDIGSGEPAASSAPALGEAAARTRASVSGEAPIALIDRKVAETLLLQTLPGINCRPQQLQLSWQAAHASQAPSILADLKTAKDDHAAVRLPETALEIAHALTRLAAAPVLAPHRVQNLLEQVPGVALAPLKQTAVRQLLLVFTSPDCVYCKAALRRLKELAMDLAFPVIVYPLGQEPCSVAFYRDHMAGPDSDAGRNTEHEGAGRQSGPRLTEQEEAVRFWLETTTQWLIDETGTDRIAVPSFAWIADGSVHLSNLSLKNLEALCAALNARAVLINKVENGPAGGS